MGTRLQDRIAIVTGADVSRGEDVRRVVDTTLERFGRFDVLHNNVGIEIVGDPVSTTEEDWDRVHAVNLKSVFLTCKHVIPHMERQGERLSAVESLCTIMHSDEHTSAG